jgi:hypothetical protein
MAIQQQDTKWQYIRPWLRRGKRLVEAAAQPWFHLRGCPPHGFGYFWHKQHEIERVLKAGTFNDQKLASGYGRGIDERIVEYPWLLSRLPKNSGRLLDAGSSLNHRFLLNSKPLQNKEITISTLAPESDAWWRRGISYVYEDFRLSCFRDGYFDWITCISTLEHVGLDNTLLYTGDTSKQENSREDAYMVMHEFRRMLRPKGSLYMTFPFGKRQNFGWFQVFNADSVALLAEAFKPAVRQDCYFGYSVDGWHPASQADLSDADCFDIHTAAAPASDNAAGARGLACLEWTI